MKLKIKNAIVTKVVLDKALRNEITSIAKNIGSDVDGDIVYSKNGDSYYVNIMQDEINKVYTTTTIDNIIHISSIFMYLLVELMSICIFYHASSDIIYSIYFNKYSIDVIFNILYLIFLSIYTLKMNRYLLGTGVISAYVRFEKPITMVSNIFIVSGLIVLAKRAIYVFIAILAMYNLYKYGFGVQLLFNMQYAVLLHRLLVVINHVATILLPNPAHMSTFVVRGTDIKKYIYYYYFGRKGIEYVEKSV